MGLLDALIGTLGQQPQAGGGPALGAAGGQGELLNVLVSMLASDGQGGGLGGLVSKFEQSGLGPVIQSWISQGQNLPISGEQLGQVLGPDLLGQLARRSGVGNGGDLAGMLSQLLPQVVDRLTPQGRLPDEGLGTIGELLGSLTRAPR